MFAIIVAIGIPRTDELDALLDFFVLWTSFYLGGRLHSGSHGYLLFFEPCLPPFPFLQCYLSGEVL